MPLSTNELELTQLKQCQARKLLLLGVLPVWLAAGPTGDQTGATMTF